MKKALERFFAIVLTIIMVLTVIPLNVFAKATEPDVVNNTTAEIMQTNSLSKLLAESADMSQVSMDSPYYISEMTFNGSTANVRYYNEQDCWLVVAVYDEETEQMLGSETTLVYAESITADLEMSIALPKHFIAKAFLLDENNAPLCKNLVCRTYTTEYEKFAEMTVNDFDSEQVVNLDKAEDNNFVVLSDNVSTIKGTNTTNTLYSSNVDTNTYVIKNIDSNVKNLKVGDSFYLDNGDIDNFLAIKVKSISISGTTATIIADDSDTDDLFECIKIDSVASAGQGEYSGETADEAVEYLGAVDYDTEEAVFNTSSVDVDFVDFSLSHKFNIKPKEYKNKSGKVEGKFSGGVTFNAKIGFSAQFSGDYKEIAFTLDPSIKVEVKVTGKIDILEIKLGSLGCTPVPGVIIGIEPEFVVKVSGELSAKCELKFTLGVGYNSKDGFINKCKKPSLEAEVKAELTLYIGFDLQPHVALLSTHVAKVTLSGEIGVEAKATLSKSSGTSTHFCSACIDGDLTAKGKIGVKLTFGEDTMLEKEYEATLVNLSWKLGNFYYSFSHNEFGFGSCPYNLKSFTIKVTDVKGSPIKNAIVSKNTAGDSGTYTNTNGEATITGSCGKITLTIEAYGYRKVTRNIDVSEDTEKFYIILKKSGVSTSDGTGSNDSVFTGFETTGTIINFGSYPQSKVTETSLIKKLDNQTKQWESYEYYTGTGSWVDVRMEPSDYMQYADFKYGGNKYRAVTFSQYRPYYPGYTSSASFSYQDDNGYYTGNVYYFKYEPLQWRVLDASEGLVMCNSAIDSQAYNNYILYSEHLYYADSSKSYYASDYGNSSIRDWLNEDFYNTAFSDGQQSRIKKNQSIDAKSIYSSSYDGTTTNDNKVFLLSYWDVINSNYGFSSIYDTARQLKSTDYAQCQGCYKYTSTSYYGNSWWRLRSPEDSYRAVLVRHDGLAYDYNSVNITYYGIVPALKLEKSTIKTSSITYSETVEVPETEADGEKISVSCSACEAGGEYVLLNVLGYGEDFVLTKENLLYIDQLTADKNNTVSTEFIPKYNNENSTTLLIGDFRNGIKVKIIKAASGDVNEDGFIDSLDALFVLQYAVETITLSNSQFALADINKDGWVNSADALMILQYSVGTIKEFPQKEEINVLSDDDILELYSTAVRKARNDIPAYTYSVFSENKEPKVTISGMLPLTDDDIKQAEDSLLSFNEYQTDYSYNDPNGLADFVPECRLEDSSELKSITVNNLENGNYLIEISFIDESKPTANGTICTALGLDDNDAFEAEFIKQSSADDVQPNIQIKELVYKNFSISCEINPNTSEFISLEVNGDIYIMSELQLSIGTINSSYTESTVKEYFNFLY